MMPATVEDFDMGRVVSRTFGTIGRNAVTFFSLAVIAVAPRLLVSSYLGVDTLTRSRTVGPANLLHFYAMLGIVTVVGLVLGAILQASLVHGTINDLNGKKASFGECLQTGLRTCLPVIGLTFLMTIAVAFGFVLLLVPGILMLLAWSVAVPVLVVEKPGITGAFGRSAQLTKGHRWAILGLGVAVWLISLLLGMAILPLHSLLTLPGGGWTATAPALAVSGVVDVVVATISAAGTAAVYYELRSIKEGIGPEQLASVFD